MYQGAKGTHRTLPGAIETQQKNEAARNRLQKRVVNLPAMKSSGELITITGYNKATCYLSYIDCNGKKTDTGSRRNFYFLRSVQVKRLLEEKNRLVKIIDRIDGAVRPCRVVPPPGGYGRMDHDVYERALNDLELMHHSGISTLPDLSLDTDTDLLIIAGMASPPVTSVPA